MATGRGAGGAGGGSSSYGEHGLAAGAKAVGRVRGVAAAAGTSRGAGGHHGNVVGAVLADHAPWTRRGRERERDRVRKTQRERHIQTERIEIERGTHG